MPYGTRTLQAREVLILEDLLNKPHTLLAVKLTAVRRYDPGPLLPPVLKAMEPKICEVCCLIMTVYAEYSTHVAGSGMLNLGNPRASLCTIYQRCDLPAYQ